MSALLVSPDQSKVVVAGRFATLDGQSPGGIGAVDAVTGASTGWSSSFPLQDASVNSGFTSLTTDGTNVIGSGYNFHGNGGSGNFEGRFESDFSGNLIWLDSCHGDTYDTFIQRGVLYEVGHSHDCSDVGAWDDTNPRSYHRALAETLTPSGQPLLHNTNSGYSDFGGLPSNSLYHWYPTLSAGTYTGQTQAAWSVTGTSDYLSLGGEFPKINGKAQQGLVRFAVPGKAPLKWPPYVATTMTPTAVSLTAGTARVRWQSTWDADNNTLTYNVYRDGGTTPVFTTTASTNFWTLPWLGFTDSGLSPGSTHTYKVSVIDPNNNRINSPVSAPVTISSTTVTPSTYANDVGVDGATEFWPLSEDSSTNQAYDRAGYDDLTLDSGVTRGAPGPIAGDAGTASTFPGTSAGSSTAATNEYAPDTFSLEAWVKTNTTTGGKIIGFGDGIDTPSTNNDRQIYMDNAGHLLFGVNSTTNKSIASSATYNDNAWHHVVASFSAVNGANLYVDGARVARNQALTTALHYEGQWRVGGDTTSGWPSAPSSPYFKGTLADVAVYPSALPLTTVQRHFADSGRTVSAPSAPADAYGAAVYADQPDLYWRLNDSSGQAVADSSPNQAPGTYTSAGVTKQQSPAFPDSGKSARFDGTSGGAASATTFPNPVVYSEEAWFKTTTKVGGRIIGFSSSATGNSTNDDRMVYMNTSGQLVFGANVASKFTVTTPGSYNDGIWHQVVATQGSDGMHLYVDGQPGVSNTASSSTAYNGYWRIGGDKTWTGSSSSFFAGSIDEVSVYPVELGADRVLAHFNAAGGTGTNAPPTASIATPSCTYLQCSFDGSNSNDPDGSIASYAWDYGDTTTGAGATPSHTYAAPGTYTVTLTVTDDSGATATATQTVTVQRAPTASFTVSCKALTCSFDATASSPGSGTITNYSWDFGDGGTDTGMTTTHKYVSAGPKSVTLTVADSANGTNSATNVAHPADNQAPTAQFTVSCPDLTCTVDGSGSSDPDGNVVGYSWNYGDGSTDTGATPAPHTYAAAGNYTITLTVTDDLGATGTKSTVVAPGDVPPTAAFTSSCSALACTFDASTSGDTDGSIKSYAWTFGDGSTGTGVAPVHIYSGAGTDTVTLTVTDDQGATGTVSHDVAPTAPLGPTPFAQDTFNRTVASGWGTADQGGAWTVSGTTSVTPGKGIFTLAKAGAASTSYLGSVSTTDADVNTTVASDKAPTGGGSYFYLVGRRVGTNTEYRAIVHLLASGAVGISFTKLAGTTTETVVKAETTVPGLTYTAGTPLHIRAQVTGTNPTTLRIRAWTGATEPTTWAATATDTSAVLQAAGGVGLRAYISGSTTNAPTTFTITSFTAQPTIAGGGGGGGGGAVDAPPTAAFTSTCVALACTFDASTSGDTDGSIKSYAWTFGDGSTGTGVAPVHIYSGAGTDTVTLTVTDDQGATGTVSHDVAPTAPLGPTPFAQDTFNRTVASGWGTADQGGAWTVSGTTSVTPGKGIFTLAKAGAASTSYLGSVSTTDADVNTTVASDKAPTGGGSYFYLVGRRVGTNTEYRAIVHLLASGAVGISFTKLAGTTTETVVKAETTVPGLTYTAGTPLHIRAQVTGTNPTTLRIRAWTGATEPTTWAATATDTSAVLQAAGGVGLRAYISGSTTNAPTTFTITSFTAQPTA